jgi:YD repeat-containing protein
MCPGIVVEGGGGAGGGAGAGGGKGKGRKAGAHGNGKGKDGKGDAAGAPDYVKYPTCGTASHPVDVATGRAFTHPIEDFALPGPLPLTFERSASSHAAGIDTGMGPSWPHTFGWQIEVRRRLTRVWTEKGTFVDFPLLEVGQKILGKWGWVLQREDWGYQLDVDDGVWRMFSAQKPGAANPTWILTAVEDRNRNRIELTYADEGARLLQVVDSAGRTLKVKTDQRGHILAFSVLNAVSQGQWVTLVEYLYDDQGRLARATDADGFASKYAYDTEEGRDEEDCTWGRQGDQKPRVSTAPRSEARASGSV